MFTLAAKDTINYLLVNTMLKGEGNFRESSKDEPIYIIVDYYDWLEFMFKNDIVSDVEFNFGTDYYAALYKEYMWIINLTRHRLNSKNIEKLMEGNISTSILPLLEGYNRFARDMENIQKYYLSRYVYNTNHFPKLIIPFSFGINRLCTGHMLFESSYRDNNKVPHIYASSGYIEDNVKRLKFDILGTGCKIVTSSYDNEFSSTNINLPKKWMWAGNKMYTGVENKITQKLSAVNNAYCNYQFKGLKERFILEPEYDNTFLLNYPFNIVHQVDRDPQNKNRVYTFYKDKVFNAYPEDTLGPL